METKGGAAVSIIGNGAGDKVKRVQVTPSDTGDGHNLYLWINDSLSYITIGEAVALRDEINAALKTTLKI